MANQTSYIERWDNDYMIGDSRVSLASVVYAWKDGLSPEEVQENLPALHLDQVYGAIAYYLAHQTEVDSYLRALDADFERRREEQALRYPEQTAKLRAALETARS